jgi:hypothetical protein
MGSDAGEGVRKMRDLKEFIDNFLGTKCICGNEKGERLSFCYECFNTLPIFLRKGLRGRLSSPAYAETFEECENYLRDEGRF